MNDDEVLERSKGSMIASKKSMNHSALASEQSEKAINLYAEADDALRRFKIITYLAKSFQANRLFRSAGHNLEKAKDELQETRCILKELLDELTGHQ